jgi:two-component system chemotaxis response regulator CheY
MEEVDPRMATSEPTLDRIQQRQSARFHRMALSARPMPGGRSLLVSLPIGPAPFESVQGPLAIERIIFSTAGPNHIKCLRPRAVFGLPLLDIRRCADAAAIETTIRQAWRDRTRELRESARLLQRLGIEVSAIEGGSVLAFPVPGESPDVRVLMQRIGEAILPSFGPLSGISLETPSDRVLEVSGSLASGTDLGCLIGGRIQELRQGAQTLDSKKRERGRQRASVISAPRHSITTKPGDHHQPKVLLVGVRVIEDAALRGELTRQGYLAATARSETEALVRLAGMTPDLVISQYSLGRSDGATLVQATRALPGIERIPVVLLDETHHASRRDAARAVGAAGYMINPSDTNRFVARLRPVIKSPGDRRFTRYSQRLAARIEGSGTPCLATEVGRGGTFIATEDDIEQHSAMKCEITLPGLGRALRFGGEVLYRSQSQGTQLKGFGIRFCEISPEDETSLIEYLAWLESAL